jgi:hypothetical protein
MRSGILEVVLAIATVAAWAAFLYLDSLWNACLSRAVQEGSKTYGEIYGPLSFFRPITMYSALALSLFSVGVLAIGSKKRRQ